MQPESSTACIPALFLSALPSHGDHPDIEALAALSSSDEECCDGSKEHDTGIKRSSHYAETARQRCKDAKLDKDEGVQPTTSPQANCGRFRVTHRHARAGGPISERLTAKSKQKGNTKHQSRSSRREAAKARMALSLW